MHYGNRLAHIIAQNVLFAGNPKHDRISWCAPLRSGRARGRSLPSSAARGADGTHLLQIKLLRILDAQNDWGWHHHCGKKYLYVPIYASLKNVLVSGSNNQPHSKP